MLTGSFFSRDVSILTLAETRREHKARKNGAEGKHEFIYRTRGKSQTRRFQQWFLF